MNDALKFSELEQVYDLVAQAIDEVGEDNESLFLGKLCIVLAHRVGDLVSVAEAVRIARGPEGELNEQQGAGKLLEETQGQLWSEPN